MNNGNADNVIYASYTVFKIITLEGWSDTMYSVRKAYGGNSTYDFFFVSVVLAGAVFVLNLMTAV